MPKNMPAIEIDDETTAPQRFQHAKHARRVDGVRGVIVRLGVGPSTTECFMDYTEAARLYEALQGALAFLDDDAE